jgi:hypothetical protein
MARPQVGDGEDGLQIWRVTANISNQQSQTADSLGVGRGAKNTHSKKNVLRNITQGLGLAGPCEHGDEPSGSITYCKFIEKLSDWRLLKKDSAPWS